MIVAEGTPETLGGRELSATRITFRAPIGTSFPFDATVDGDVVTIEAQDPTTDVHRLTGWAIENGVELEDLTVTRPSLEDVYLALTEED